MFEYNMWVTVYVFVYKLITSEKYKTPIKISVEKYSKNFLLEFTLKNSPPLFVLSYTYLLIRASKIRNTFLGDEEVDENLPKLNLKFYHVSIHTDTSYMI